MKSHDRNRPGAPHPPIRRARDHLARTARTRLSRITLRCSACLARWGSGRRSRRCRGRISPPANAAAPRSAKPCDRGDERVVSPHRHGHVAAVHACAGDSLDVLLRPGLPVSIPDAVYIEATRVRGAPGADRIVEWINDHLDTVRIIPTDIGVDQQRRLGGPLDSRTWRASRDRGAGAISPLRRRRAGASAF